MSKVTLETLHTLLEGLAQYVMSEVPTKQEVERRFQQIDRRFQQIEGRFVNVENELEKKADKSDIQLILEGMDTQAKQHDIIRTELSATNATLLRHEKRLTTLEERGKAGTE